MSSIVVNGRSYAAALYWLDRTGPAATARAARRFARPWCVHHAGQTGYAGGVDEDAPEGLPALAPALLQLIDGEFWMALIAGEAPPGGKPAGESERYALIKVRDGAVLADGDEVFTRRDAAIEAFGRARALGWELYATPGLLDAGANRNVRALDVSGLPAGPGIALRRAPFTGVRRRHMALALLLPAVLSGAAFAWLGRDTLVSWIVGPEPVAVVAPPAAEAELPVSVDSAALIEACRRALIDYPPWLPAWRIETLSCAARFADPELAALRPELAGRAVMLVRWRLAAGHAEPLHRQLAEQHLSRWYAASVVDARAWAAAPLAPVLRIEGRTPPPFLALRRAVDRGLAGARIDYARGPQGGWTVRIGHSGSLSGLAGRIRGITDTAGLEITRLDRAPDGAWRLQGRPMAPEAMTRTAFRAASAPAPVPGGIPPRAPAPNSEQGVSQ